MGHGEGDVAHKAGIIIHKGELFTGAPVLFSKWRWCQRGVCADQGWEREVADSPNVNDTDQVRRALQQLASGEVKLIGSNPEAYLFPCMLFVTGPMHILWNAYETSCTAITRGQKFSDLLGGVLAMLGHKGTRDRFLDVCMKDSTPYKAAAWLETKLSMEVGVYGEHVREAESCRPSGSLAL